MKLIDKITKVDETFEVTRHDNGFVIEVRGEDSEGEWETAKIVVKEQEEVHELLTEYLGLPRT